jgi:hypothetical protein
MTAPRFNPYQVDVPRALALLGLEAEHRGDGWVMRCPSGRHADQKPSFVVKDVPGEPKHGLSHCFACKFGGTMAELVAHVIGITLPGAYGWLTDNALGGMLDVRRVTVQVKPFARSGGMTMPEGVVIAPMTEWPVAAQRYALDRNIAPWQVDRWGMGYAVEGRLAGRIIIPVWGPNGELLQYTSRTYVRSPAKYISAKRSEGPDMSAVFGEALWPDTESDQRDAVVVTEGALNALAVERVLPMPFASLFGSDVSLGHLLKLGTFRKVIVLTEIGRAHV